MSYVGSTTADMELVGKTACEAMSSLGLTPETFADRFASKLGIQHLMARRYATALMKGTVWGISTRSFSPNRQTHLDRLAIAMRALQISLEDPAVLTLKQAHPEFSYPPAISALAHNPNRAKLLTEILDYAVLRAAVLSTTAPYPGADSWLLRAPTADYEQVMNAAEPYDALPGNAEPAYPKDLVEGFAEGLLLMLHSTNLKRAMRVASVKEAKSLFGTKPTLDSVVGMLAVDISFLEQKLSNLEERHMVALLPDGAYTATNEGIKAYQSSQIARALLL